MLAFGRYMAFGLICLPLGWRDRRRLAALERRDWLAALELFTDRQHPVLLEPGRRNPAGRGSPADPDHRHPARCDCPDFQYRQPKLALAPAFPLADCHRAGHRAWSISTSRPARPAWESNTGWASCWQSQHSSAGPGIPSVTPAGSSSAQACRPAPWATAQGLTTLPLSLIGMAGSGWWFAQQPGFIFPLGPRPPHLYWSDAHHRAARFLAGHLVVEPRQPVSCPPPCSDN